MNTFITGNSQKGYNMEFTKREYQQFYHGISMSLLSKESAQKWRYDDKTAEEIRFLKGLESKVLDKINQADTPQTDAEIPKNALRSDCTGCRFVGAYDTEFPCANCVRKNKDYYSAEQTESTGSPIGDYRDGVGAWQTDCGWK